MAIEKQQVLDWITTYAAELKANRDYLVQLDAAIGDADHGANMDRGFQAVLAKLPGVADKDIGTILKTVAMTLISTVGGASGPLYGTVFLQAATVAGGKDSLTETELVSMFEAALKGVVARGKAEPGDKTMIDAFTPAVNALKAAVDGGASTADALAQATAAAEQGMQATTPLVARKGRASYLGERSAGHQDPGATSTYLLFKSASETMS
jgi:dihydroxyacetone kinase-like protein